jgi:3',5'-cyclic AMP phosphodiesterase CpdA
MAIVRLAHFSDIHVVAAARWRFGDVFSKRLTTWANLRLLRRAARFRETTRVLAALRADLADRAFDHLVFSGDATAMGFEAEVARAAESLPLTMPGLAVPGNHDYCTRAAMRSGAFERHFAPWQRGERIDDAVYPFAQRVGPAWLIGVNSATGNRLPHDARGRVGRPQLDRLRRLLARLDEGPRILVTHYPIARHSGAPEGLMHGLRDLAELMEVAQAGGVDLWLHGHRHEAYHHPKSSAMPIASICAGSATQTGLWSYQELVIDGRRVRGCVRTYGAGRFVAGAGYEMEL